MQQEYETNIQDNMLKQHHTDRVIYTTLTGQVKCDDFQFKKEM